MRATSMPCCRRTRACRHLAPGLPRECSASSLYKSSNGGFASLSAISTSSPSSPKAQTKLQTEAPSSSPECHFRPATPPPSPPATPVISGRPKPRHDAPRATRRHFPKSIWGLKPLEPARASSSSAPTELASTAATSTPAIPGPIPLYLSKLRPSSTLPHHSLVPSPFPGRRHHWSVRAVAGPRRQAASDHLGSLRTHRHAPGTPWVPMLPLVFSLLHPTPSPLFPSMVGRRVRLPRHHSAAQITTPPPIASLTPWHSILAIAAVSPPLRRRRRPPP